MNVNYEYYRIFYYVAKTGSFSRAAEALLGSQPNITRAMNRLEEQLGCKLFLRSNRGVALTPEGQRLYSRVKIAQNQLQEAENELAGLTSLQQGTISLGASETALNLFLLEQLRQFHAVYPDIRLKMSNHSTPQALAALERGTVDLAVVTTPAPARRGEKITTLLPFREVLVGGSSFAAMAGKTHTLAQVAACPLVTLGRDTITYAFYEKLFREQGLTLAPDTEVATADQLLPLVEYNLGLAFVPWQLARPALESGRVVRIPLDRQPPARQVVLIRDGQRPLSLAARRLEEMLTAAAQPDCETTKEQFTP